MTEDLTYWVLMVLYIISSMGVANWAFQMGGT